MSIVKRDSQEIVDHLRVQLVDGETGKVKYDSDRDNKKPQLAFPPDPLKFCPACGGKPVTLIYYCPACGLRYQQVYDKKTKRIMISTMPEEPADKLP